MTATPEGSGFRQRRRLNTVAAGDGDPRHGKYTTYTNHKCHCNLCRAAWSEYCRDLRDRRANQAAS